MSNEKKANFVVVIISLVLIAMGTGMMLLLAYKINTIPKKIDIKTLKSIDNNDMIEISKVYEDGNYLRMEGYLKKEFKRYQLYVGIKNENDEIIFFRTKYHGEDNKVTSIIKKDLIKNDSEIYIAYMCDDENLLIDTGRNVGEAYER